MTGGPNTETGHPEPVRCRCVWLDSHARPRDRCPREATPPAVVCSGCAGSCQLHEDAYGLVDVLGLVGPSLAAQRKGRKTQ